MTDSAWNDPPWRAPRPDDRGTASPSVTRCYSCGLPESCHPIRDNRQGRWCAGYRPEPEQNRNGAPQTEAETAPDLH